MAKFFLKRKIMLATVTVITANGICLIHYGYFWRNFKRINNLTIVSADRQKVSLSIPVRYTTLKTQFKILGQLGSNNKKIYLVKKSLDGKRIFLTVSKWTGVDFLFIMRYMKLLRCRSRRQLHSLCLLIEMVFKLEKFRKNRNNVVWS